MKDTLKDLPLICSLAAFTVLFAFVGLINIGVYVNTVFFWASIIVVIVALLYQIVNYEPKTESSRYGKFIVLEIFLLTFALHLLAARPGSIDLSGHDPHFEYASAKTILSSGWPIPNNIQIMVKTRDYSEWPMLDILALGVSQTLHLDLLTVAKWLPVLFNPLAVVFLYLFSQAIYDDKRVAFIASLSFAGVFPYINFQSRFVRESFAFVILLACLYGLVMAKKTEAKAFHSIAIFLIILLVFSHHLTSFVLLLFLFFALVSFQIGSRLFKVKGFSRKTILVPSLGLLVLLLTLDVSYWAFIGEFVIRAFTQILGGLSFTNLRYPGGRLTGGSIRVVMASYGNLFFLGVFGTVILLYLLRNRKKANISDFTFTLFGGGWIVFSYLSLYISSFQGVDFSRLANFGYVFFLIPVAHALIGIKYKKILAILIGAFILLQVLTIPAYYYDLNARPEYSYGAYREYYLQEEFVATRFPLYGQVAGDWTSYELFGGVQQVNVQYQSERVAQIFGGNVSLMKDYDWLIFRYEDFNLARVGVSKPVVVTNDTHARFDNAVFLAKVYSNGQVDIYRTQSSLP